MDTCLTCIQKEVPDFKPSAAKAYRDFAYTVLCPNTKANNTAAVKQGGLSGSGSALRLLAPLGMAGVAVGLASVAAAV